MPCDSRHDRHNRWLGHIPAAEGRVVRLIEACIGCRSVDSHASIEEIITQPQLELLSGGIEFAVVGSMLSNSQEVLVEGKSTGATPPSDLHGPKGPRPARNACSYLAGSSTLSTTPCRRSTSSIILSPCLSLMTATIHAKALTFVSFTSVLEHALMRMYGDRQTSYPDTLGLVNNGTATSRREHYVYTAWHACF